MPTIHLTYFHRLTEPQGRRYCTTWPKLLGRLTTPREVADKHDVPGVSLATFRNDRRALANVEAVYAIGLDLDKGVDWSSFVTLFGATDSFLHTTWSSTPTAPRARVFLRLSRPVTSDEYRRVYRGVADTCEAAHLVVDRQASDPSRFWFLPSIPPGGSYWCSIGRGQPVNVEGALACVPPSSPAPRPPLSSARPGDSSVEARAAAYLARCAPAISGSGGHATTFVTAQRLVRGFALDEETAFRLICVWNETCQPPWSERELRRKIKQAADHGAMPEGELRDRRRAS
jgi:hypothetical protein